MSWKNELLEKTISSWANTNFSRSIVVVPETIEDIFSIIQTAKHSGKKVLARGAGQSYGDEALNDENAVIDMSKMNRILEWNRTTGLLRAQAGATYEEVLIHCLKDNWTPAVIPGTRYVTMGGALSNNVHGKNSYAQGNFGAWVQEFKIVLASSKQLTCSRKENSDLFFAAIGGAGLLGIVTEMTLQLVRVPSAYLSVKKNTATSLKKLLEELDEASRQNDFVIAQVDCFPQNSGLGRGTIHTGSFTPVGLETENVEAMRDISPRMFGFFPKQWVTIIGKYVLNNYTMKWISRLKYYLDKMTSSKTPHNQDLFQFTFLLDKMPNWKKVFRYGFFEYEPLIPKEKALKVFLELIALSHEYDMPAYLSAIKIHSQDDFLLSYSGNGYSFGMDFSRRPQKIEEQKVLFRRMNKIVIEAGGIVYLAKDANLNAGEFRQMYGKVEPFLTLKKKYDPYELFQSDMYRRIFK